MGSTATVMAIATTCRRRCPRGAVRSAGLWTHVRCPRGVAGRLHVFSKVSCCVSSPDGAGRYRSRASDWRRTRLERAGAVGDETTSGRPFCSVIHPGRSSLYWEAHVTALGRVNFYGSTSSAFLHCAPASTIASVTCKRTTGRPSGYLCAVARDRAAGWISARRARQPIERRRVTVEVKQEDGSLAVQSPANTRPPILDL